MRKSTLTFIFSAAVMPTLANIGDLPQNPSTNLITDPLPSAERVTLVKTGLGFIRIDDELDALPSDGSLTRMVRGEDKIYLGNIFSWADDPGWIEGTVEGDKAIFRLPQLIKDEIRDINGILTPYSYYAVACDMVVRGGSADMVPTVDQTYTFIIKEDGSLVPEDDELFIGNFLFSDNNWEWNMDGDFYTALSPQSLKAIDTPADVQFIPMVLSYPHILYGGAYAKEVQVGFSGNDCYVKGLAVGIGDLQDAVVKGELADNGKVISFESNQFLGDSWLFGFTQFLIGGETEYVEDPRLGYRPRFTPMDRLEFAYDPSARSMTSDMSFIIVPSLQEDTDNLYYENIYNSPSICYSDPEDKIRTLVNPELNAFTPAADGMPNILDFAVSMVSADHHLLDMTKLYFEIYIDGEPFEFTPAIDPALKEPASRILFGTTDYECFVAQEGIIQMVAIPDMQINSMSLRLVYLGDPENPLFSDFVTVRSNAVEGIVDASATTEGYTDLSGRRVENPTPGIYIRTIRSSDGSVRHEKTLVR